MEVPEARLILGFPIPHSSAAATTFGTSVSSLSATSAANYVQTGTPGGTIVLGTSNCGCVRFVTVANLSPASNEAQLYVTVGNTGQVPPAPSAGSFAIGPQQRYTFQIQGAGNGVVGIQGFIKVLGSAAGLSGSVQWHM
jgi:hypothetical protein